MRRLRNIVILLSLAVTLTLVTRRDLALKAWAQVQSAAQNGVASLRIISPRNGDKLQQNFVTAQYTQLQQASPTATFELRLDAQDPVHTTDTSYTFTGLTPGAHDLVIHVVDANGTPLFGSRAEIRFTVLPQPNTSPGTPPNPQSATQGASAEPGNQSLGATGPRTEEMKFLPDARSSLPLLSVIGFGILLGGILSALRTRPAR